MAAVASLLDREGVFKPHPRAAAFLIRRALEEHLDAYVRRNRPALARCSMGTKTVWLAHHLDSALAGRMAAVWHSLSCACHHQQYAMAPTVGEILSWRTEVEHVLAAMG
jgi:cytochrome c5